MKNWGFEGGGGELLFGEGYVLRIGGFFFFFNLENGWMDELIFDFVFGKEGRMKRMNEKNEKKNDVND